MANIKVLKNRLTEFEFDMNIKGSAVTPDAPIKANMVITGKDGFNLSVPCRKLSEGKWCAPVPPLKKFIAESRCKYSLEVVYDGWHFEPAAGDMIFEDEPQVKVARIKEATLTNVTREPDTRTANIGQRQAVSSPGNTLLKPEMNPDDMTLDPQGEPVDSQDIAPNGAMAPQGEFPAAKAGIPTGPYDATAMATGEEQHDHQHPVAIEPEPTDPQTQNVDIGQPVVSVSNNNPVGATGAYGTAGDIEIPHGNTTQDEERSERIIHQVQAGIKPERKNPVITPAKKVVQPKIKPPVFAESKKPAKKAKKLVESAPVVPPKPKYDEEKSKKILAILKETDEKSSARALAEANVAKRKAAERAALEERAKARPTLLEGLGKKKVEETKVDPKKEAKAKSILKKFS